MKCELKGYDLLDQLIELDMYRGNEVGALHGVLITMLARMNGYEDHVQYEFDSDGHREDENDAVDLCDDDDGGDGDGDDNQDTDETQTAGDDDCEQQHDQHSSQEAATLDVYLLIHTDQTLPVPSYHLPQHKCNPVHAHGTTVLVVCLTLPPVRHRLGHP